MHKNIFYSCSSRPHKLFKYVVHMRWRNACTWVNIPLLQSHTYFSDRYASNHKWKISNNSTIIIKSMNCDEWMRTKLWFLADRISSNVNNECSYASVICNYSLKRWLITFVNQIHDRGSFGTKRVCIWRITLFSVISTSLCIFISFSLLILWNGIYVCFVVPETKFKSQKLIVDSCVWFEKYGELFQDTSRCIGWSTNCEFWK